LSLQPLTGFSICVFYLLPKFAATELGAGASQIGLISAAYGLASVLALPLLGLAIDRGSARWLVMAAALALAAAALGYLAVDRVGPLLLALRLVQGMAWALSFTSGMMITTALAPPARLSQAIGYYGSSSLAMNAIAPAIAETMVEHAGWRPVFVLATLTAVAAFALARALPDIRAERGDARVGLLTLLGQPRSRWMAVVVLIWGSAFGAMFTFSQPFALALKITHVRGFFLMYTAAALFSRIGVGNLADRVGHLRVSIGALILYGMVVLAMQFLRAGWLEPIGAVFGLAHGLFFPAFSALTLSSSPHRERGKLTALSNAAFNAGIALNGVVLGALAEGRGYPFVFLVAGVATLGGVVLLFAGFGLPRAELPGSSCGAASSSPRIF
jgi:predicted MFS family arabinose efflux permease